jgi:hypothetical protein
MNNHDKKQNLFRSTMASSLSPNRSVALEDASVRGTRKRMNKSARARERKRLKQCSALEWVDDDGDEQDGLFLAKIGKRETGKAAD